MGATTAAALPSAGGGGGAFSSYGTFGAAGCAFVAGALHLGLGVEHVGLGLQHVSLGTQHFGFGAQHLTRVGLAQEYADLWQDFSLLCQPNNPASADPVGNRKSATGSRITQPIFMASPK